MRPAKRRPRRPCRAAGVALINGERYVVDVHARVLRRLDDPDEVIHFGDDNAVPGN